MDDIEEVRKPRYGGGKERGRSDEKPERGNWDQRCV